MPYDPEVLRRRRAAERRRRGRIRLGGLLITGLLAVMAGLAWADPDSFQGGPEGKTAFIPRRPAGAGPRGSGLSRPPIAAGRRRPIKRSVAVAKRTYHHEALGGPVFVQLRRIAKDRVLLADLGAGDLVGAQAEAAIQLSSPANHHAHVTRIGVMRGSRVIVNAVVNANGSFVVAPATRELRWHGRRVGTLLISIQDVIGFIKLVHKFTGSEVVVRGSSGQVRTSLPAAASVQLPRSGRVTLDGRTYLTRSFPERGWGGERLRVWILRPV